ncbi:hypothetical protein [Parasediminibacterium sp. JCM 36343]|uniref:hypothetical protein n=1 Tax=Parasediminibacterium sp. JCM 36343 TaxID=3374279 RepID=UPI00397E31C3
MPFICQHKVCHWQQTIYSSHFISKRMVRQQDWYNQSVIMRVRTSISIVLWIILLFIVSINDA